MRIENPKSNFRGHTFLPKVPSRGVKVKNNDFSKYFKTPGVGTLNLCLKVPDTMEKELAKSDHPVLRKSPKSDQI